MNRSSSFGLFAFSFFFVSMGPACTQAGSDGDGGSGGDGGASTDSEGATTTGSGGGTATGNPFFADPPEGKFSCGDGECAAATEMCVKQIDGMCCGQHYGCKLLPTTCGELEPDCGCIKELACPCVAGCGPSSGVSCQRHPETGVFSLTCANP